MIARDSEEVKQAKKKRRTEIQLDAWRYFCNPTKDGCLVKWNHVSDAQYDALIRKQCEEYGLNTPERIIKKMGLEIEDVCDFDPIVLEDFIPEMKTAESNLCWKGNDNVIRTSNYQVTWLLCSKSQIFVYQCTFSMLESDKKEVSEEFFFRDVTNFSTIDVSDEITIPHWVGGGCTNSVGCGKPPRKVYDKVTINNTRFRITVPGDKIECAMTSSAQMDANIRRLKALLREKKNA